jgi:hypothetical protein
MASEVDMVVIFYEDFDFLGAVCGSTECGVMEQFSVRIVHNDGTIVDVDCNVIEKLQQEETS